MVQVIFCEIFLKVKTFFQRKSFFPWQFVHQSYWRIKLLKFLNNIWIYIWWNILYYDAYSKYDLLPCWFIILCKLISLCRWNNINWYSSCKGYTMWFSFKNKKNWKVQQKLTVLNTVPLMLFYQKGRKILSLLQTKKCDRFHQKTNVSQFI